MTFQFILPPLSCSLTVFFFLPWTEIFFRNQSCSLKIASLLTLPYKFCLSRFKQIFEKNNAKLSRKPGKLDRLQLEFTSKILSFGKIKSNGFSLGSVGVVYKRHRCASIYDVYSTDKWKSANSLLSLFKTTAYIMKWHSKVIMLLRYWTDWISTCSVIIA